MCGIVGLLVKKPELKAQLGALMLPMLIGMGERGPDSAGLAVFGDALPAAAGRRYSLHAPEWNFDWAACVAALNRTLAHPVEFTAKGNHAILISTDDPQKVAAAVAEHFPALHLLSVGRSIDVYKDVGHPAAVAERYAFKGLTGTHLVGHTRMATESAVTPAHAHPFTAGEDFCLVHNGSLSNPYSIRRKLEPLGIHFDTDNDTEAACRYLEWRMREGDNLEAALESSFRELDGFFTFLIGTGDSLALVRDPFACKPAVVAETDDYVAIASEFRSLAKLPGVKHANLFEPVPEQLYVWKS
jgi:amidophosphoribosyltransferase